MGVIKFFDIRQLKPFHRRGDRLPQPAPEKEDLIAELDPNLTPEEQAYVNHYVGYADVLLNESEEEDAPVQQKPDNVVEIPRKDQERKAASDDSEGQKKIA